MNTSHLALNRTDASTRAIHAYLTFRVGTQWYAVAVENVFEVTNLVAISAVPDMPPSVLGVVNIRGNVVPIVDLRRRFHLAQPELELNTPIIFLQHSHDAHYGIVVDDVDDVISLADEAIKQSALSQGADHIAGIIDHDDQLIMLLAPHALLMSSLNTTQLTHLLPEPTTQPKET